MTWEVTDELFPALQHFICLVYAPSTKTTSMNQLRHELFYTKLGEVESSSQAPYEDALRKHVMHATYQAAIWRWTMERNSVVPDPTRSWMVKRRRPFNNRLDEWKTSPRCCDGAHFLPLPTIMQTRKLCLN